MAEEANKHEFRAEVRKVLNILTNSLYTNREIFLRELISNASDALDKLRFRSNRGEKPIRDDLPLEIRINLDKDKKLLTIFDTGLGMTETELGDNLGTIARSGSESFLADFDQEHQGADAKDASNIIGRFGVGFYSVFMVADKVTVSSRYAFPEGDGGNDVYVWTSDGLGTYTLEKSSESKPARGTVIEVHMKEDATEFLEQYRIESVIKKHSAFIPFPIFVNGDQVNTQPALWREPKSSVTEEQYTEFFKSLTYESEPPMNVQHIAVDVPVQFAALLFIPNKPQDLRVLNDDHWGVDLYSRRVLIQHQNKDVVPDYLGFLKGVVDVEDLPLNISRETLQENTLLMKIKQVLIKQTLGQLEKMAKDEPEKYEKFWKVHRELFKLGYQDYANHERITALFRFNSSAMPDGEAGQDVLTSIDDYISRGKEKQKTIWYLASHNRQAAKLNPHMEMFRKKGLEVLFLYDSIDDFVMSNMNKYKEWNFKSIENAKIDDLKDFPDLEKDAEEKEEQPLSEADTKIFDDLVAHIKKELGDKVGEVRVSQKLADSPAVLVSKEGLSNSMERFYRAMSKDDSLPVRDLEVNRDHPLLRSMFAVFKADANDAVLKEMIDSLFDFCMLFEGYIKEPQIVASQAQKMLAKSAGWYVAVRNLK
ncbi:MAG: molecular chaperone HtpG [Desulfovibrionaceae bacterium]|nr:molecular chaperone HtpG [Desulfovibrionaceae bacterium]